MSEDARPDTNSLSHLSLQALHMIDTLECETELRGITEDDLAALRGLHERLRIFLEQTAD